MKIPKKFSIKKSDAVLGTTTSKGLIKRKINPDYWKKYPPSEINKHNEFIALINGYKPIIGANISNLKKNIREHPELVKYIRSIKIYMLDTSRSGQARLWIDKQEYKHVLLITYWQKRFSDDIKLLFEKLKNLDKSISGFAHEYIVGTMYGYRKSSIRGYYLSKYVKKESDWEPFKKSEQYKIYHKDYHKMVKICNVWIKYMIDNSKEFKKYEKEMKNKIKIFSV